MNILMLTASDTGGVFVHITTVVKEILRRNQDNVFIGCEHHDKVCEYRALCPTYELNFHSKNPKTIIKTLLQLRDIIETNKIDIVHCHYRTAALYMRILNIGKPINYIWTNHLVPIPHDFFHRKFTFYGKKAIAIGTESKRFLMDSLRIPEKDIEIVFHGVNTEYFHTEGSRNTLLKRYGIMEGEKVIVLLGRLVEIKGHEFLLNSVSCLDNVKILFTGDGSNEYKEYLIDKAKHIGVLDKIVFTGFVNPYEILQIADVMVLPSKMEGFAISTLESFFMRVPVVRTKTGGYADMKDLCLGVEYGDTVSLKHAIQKALLRDLQVDTMIEAAHERIVNDWNIVTMVDRLLAIYDHCK